MRRQRNALNAGCMINNFTPATLQQLIDNNREYIKNNREYTQRNFEINVKLREDLSLQELELITKIINELKNKYGMEEDAGVFFKPNTYGYTDIPCCSEFFIKLNDYKKYFERLTYNSYLEGVIEGEL